VNTQNRATQESIPADRLAEAGVWIARLHGDERDRSLEAGFRQWLKADPLNGRAFELATEVWDDSQNLRRVVPFAHEPAPTRRNRSRRSRIAVAASLVAVTALLVVGAMLLVRQQEGIVTGVGEQRLIVLEDGTRVLLNTLTRVVAHYDKNARRIELKSGEAWFEVAKKPRWPLIVTAGDRQVTALGTSFAVRYDPDRTAITLVEGKVAVSAATGEAPTVLALPIGRQSAGETAEQPELITLTPGQRLTYTANKPAQLDTPSLDKATAWRRGQVVLDDTPLRDAVVEMNRYNAIKLSIEDPRAAGILVNGLFQAGDSVSFANAVAQIHGLRVVERDEEIILEGSPGSVARMTPPR
jgi:transmembrane sensor